MRPREIAALPPLVSLEFNLPKKRKRGPGPPNVPLPEHLRKRKSAIERKMVKHTAFIVKRVGDYCSRNNCLLSLGFDSYRAYLSSPLWKRIRSRVLCEKGNFCIRCGAETRLVHHSDYRIATLEGRDLSGLHPVCHGCHGFAEVAPSGEKRSLGEANSLLGLTRRSSKKPSKPKVVKNRKQKHRRRVKGTTQ